MYCQWLDTTMKKLFISSLLTSGLFLWQTLPTLADGVRYYRNLQANSILQCSSPKQIEISYVGAGIASSSSSLTILCLKNDRQAQWIMQSSVTCQSQKNLPQKCTSFDFKDDKNNTLMFSPGKTAIGINCTIKTQPEKYSEDLDYYWSCEKYQARKNLTIKTTGQKPLQSRSNGEEKFWLHTDDNPSCKSDPSFPYACFQPYPDLGNDGTKYRPEMAIDCRGDAEFCKSYYQPQY